MRKKILFVTPDYSFFAKPVTDSLAKLGFNVKTFDNYKANFVSRVAGVLENAPLISQTISKNYVKRLVNLALLQVAKKFQPGHLLVIKGENISAETIKKITNSGVVTINWYSDWFDSWDWISQNAQNYSFFFNMCKETHRRLKGKNVTSFYLPVASYLDTPQESLPKKYPVTFVGRHTPRREKYFKAIKDLGLTIWGYHQWKQSSLGKIAKGPVSVSDSRKIIKQSKITVNILNGSDNHQPDQINTRTVETTSVGSFLLVHSAPAIKRYFQSGKELITFNSPQDLRKKVIYYLNNENKREKIAAAGYLRAKKDHLLKSRVKQLFLLAR